MMRSALGALLAVGLLAGCADLGGTDRRSDGTLSAAEATRETEGGIGGTGAPARGSMAAGDETEGGIGGTGIFGMITAFGSIVVNGLTVEFADDVVQSQAPSIGVELPLTVGSAVIVEARAEGTDWTADRVSLFLPLVGPVTAVGPASSTLEVMGTPVLLDRDAAIVDRRGYVDGKVIDLDDIAVGDRLAVSGLWKGGEVIATRIDRLTTEGPDSVNGLLLETDGGMVVGGTRLGRDCCDGLSTPAYGRVTGEFRGQRFDVDRLETGTALLFGEGVDRLVVEAYLARDPDGEGFHLSGFGIPADQSSPIDAEPGVRSLFLGSYDDRFRIQRSAPLPANETGRIDAFEALGDRPFPTE